MKRYTFSLFCHLSPEKILLVWVAGLKPGVLHACVYALRSTEVLKFHRCPAGPPRATAWCHQPCPESLCQWLSIIPSPSMCPGSHSSLWVTTVTVAAQCTNIDTQVSPPVPDYHHGDPEKHNMGYATLKGDQIRSLGLFVDGIVVVQQICPKCVCIHSKYIEWGSMI